MDDLNELEWRYSAALRESRLVVRPVMDVYRSHTISSSSLWMEIVYKTAALKRRRGNEVCVLIIRVFG